MLRMLTGILLVVPTVAGAVPLCKDATATSMHNPPVVREVSFFVPPLADQLSLVSVTVRGATIASVEFEDKPLSQEPLRDNGKANHVAVYRIAAPTDGTHRVRITYTQPPTVDAVVIATCSGAATDAIKNVSRTETGDTREVFELEGKDAAKIPVTIAGSDARDAEIHLSAGGLSIRTYNKLVIR